MQFGGIWGGALRARTTGVDRWLGLVLAAALVLLALGRQQEAIADLRKALTLNLNPEIRERSVNSLKELGVEP